MFRTKWIAACALVALCAAVPVAARPRHANVDGTITAVTTSPATITINDDGRSITLGVNSATDIRVEDSPGGFSDLTVGSEVKVRYTVATQVATRIRVETDDDDPDDDDNQAIGVVLGVDTVTGAVTIDTNGDGVADLTLATNTGTELELGDADLTPAELALLEGLRVRVEFNDAFVAEEIEASVAGAVQVSGQVIAIDPTTGLITVRTATGDVVVQLLSDADIRINGRETSLPAVQVGDNVRVVFLTNADNINVGLRLHVISAPQHVHGTLTAVSGQTLIITARDGSTVTLTVDANTDIRVNGRRTTLARLAEIVADGSVKMHAQFFDRGTTDLATKVHVNVRAGGRRGQR